MEDKRANKWTQREDALLLNLMSTYQDIIVNPSNQTKKHDWKPLEPFFPGRNAQQIMNRWTKSLNPSLVRGKWTKEEDELIVSWVSTNGPTKWNEAAQRLHVRTGKQCRERWENSLNTLISKSPFTKEEDQIIIEMVALYGRRWSYIAQYLVGRTDNQIKNRWNSALKRKSRLSCREIRKKSQSLFNLPKINLAELPAVFPPTKVNNSESIGKDDSFSSYFNSFSDEEFLDEFLMTEFR